MWFIIIALVLVALFYFSIKQSDKDFVDKNILQGGLRKSYPNLTIYLEEFYEMQFLADTGKEFSYVKALIDTNGKNCTLFLGIKIDIKQKPIIFSRYKNIYLEEHLGTDVVGTDFDNLDSINEGINISLAPIQKFVFVDVGTFDDFKKNISFYNNFLDDWEKFKRKMSDGESSDIMSIFIANFFIPDFISVSKFVENFDILENTWKGLEKAYGTKSVKGLYGIPPSFSNFFVAGYPDVYVWFQQNTVLKGRIEIQSQIEKLPNEEIHNYFNNPAMMREFFRSLINQYTNEGNELECSAINPY